MSLLNKFKKLNKDNFKKGFTLVELLVAVSLFVVVSTVSIMALITVKEANAKAQVKRNVLNNLSFAVENMARNLRVGTVYSCNRSSLSPAETPVGVDCVNGEDNITFKDYLGDAVTYSLDGDSKVILKKITGIENQGRTTPALPITSPDVQIDTLRFIVREAGAGGLQPFAVIFVEGVAKPGTKLETRFKVQTSASQRVLDF
ncbi:MAG: Uncharacterized protein LiPW30_320 [Parcubacteria group bacterium LiPW_30]|nr:MAG: Uncharacterized protein LiPW30_320 [Parcubacteria group bacterium LiPW_30]